MKGTLTAPLPPRVRPHRPLYANRKGGNPRPQPFRVWRFFLSAELDRTRARYNAAREKACRQASLLARAFYGDAPITIAPVGAKARAAFAEWPGEREWDWAEIRRVYASPKVLEFAIWCEETLCAVGLVTVSDGSVTLKYVEGRPDRCPLEGSRVPIALELASCYAQACGRTVLRIEPIRPTLIERCQTDWGFKPDSSAKGYFRKDL